MGVKNSKRVMVCDRCLRACCYYGVFYCDDARTAGTKIMTAGQLRPLKREHESYWTADEMTRVYGEPEPFGYA